jgi:hypothetical protein
VLCVRFIRPCRDLDRLSTLPDAEAPVYWQPPLLDLDSIYVHYHDDAAYTSVTLDSSSRMLAFNL